MSATLSARVITMDRRSRRSRDYERRRRRHSRSRSRDKRYRNRRSCSRSASPEDRGRRSRRSRSPEYRKSRYYRSRSRSPSLNNGDNGEGQGAKAYRDRILKGMSHEDYNDEATTGEKATRELTEEEQLQQLLGFSGFDSSKGKAVENNDVGAVKIAAKREYRQYMNRKGAFNKPLS